MANKFGRIQDLDKGSTVNSKKVSKQNKIRQSYVLKSKNFLGITFFRCLERSESNILVTFTYTPVDSFAGQPINGTKRIKQ